MAVRMTNATIFHLESYVLVSTFWSVDPQGFEIFSKSLDTPSNLSVFVICTVRYGKILWELWKSAPVVNAVNPLCPSLWEYLLSKILLLFLADGRVLNTVERELFQVSNAELPSSTGIDVVQCDSFVSEQAWIIWAYWELNSSSHKVVDWMGSQVFGVAEDHVAKWAALNADVSFLHEFLKMWEQE